MPFSCDTCLMHDTITIRRLTQPNHGTWLAPLRPTTLSFTFSFSLSPSHSLSLSLSLSLPPFLTEALEKARAGRESFYPLPIQRRSDGSHSRHSQNSTPLWAREREMAPGIVLSCMAPICRARMWVSARTHAQCSSTWLPFFSRTHSVCSS